ncbi:MAG: hypothetical protein CBD16_01715 [Betaproteobacteria bacterium TMED156]|nr:MAG: hypothetical protein CBD16_01715 [Betaproteobacteria bacterium TMED156]|tara:strand:+ start:17 stop:604 length:588 start_codon:yes stop_codon:yes gene_type:complete
MSTKIKISSLWSLEDYSKKRDTFRSEVLEHKKNRRVSLGDHISLLFEDEKTVRYQIQEMLRIERTFESSGILDELEAYNPLIPDGMNLKCTMMIEYPNIEERKKVLQLLKSIEHKVWIRVEGCDKVWSIADEDIERSNENKTSAVHFLRFELNQEMISALKYGVCLSMGVDHPEYAVAIDPLPVNIRTSLVGDLN